MYLTEFTVFCKQTEMWGIFVHWKSVERFSCTTIQHGQQNILPLSQIFGWITF